VRRPVPSLSALSLALAALLGGLRAGVVSAAPPPPAEHDAEITKAELSAWVKALADDAMEGRESGEAGADRASTWLAAEFERLGLRPAGDGGTFFQQFTIPRGMKVLPETALVVTGKGGKAVPFRLAEEFGPADVSAAGDVTADAVFAGYGIRAPEHGYDDYADLDAKGRVVVVLRRAPAWEDKKSPFATPQALEKFASFQAKADAAAAAGAVALVIVNDPATSTTKEKDDLKPPGGGQAGKLPVVQVVWKGAGARLSDALGLALVKRQAQLDGKLMPRSEALDGVTVRVRCALEPEVRKVRNVAAMLVPQRTVTAAPATTGPGAAGPAAGEPNETVIVGAHYDHVGRGRFGSLAGASADGKIHNGADDNASGTAALLEMAGWLTARKAELSRRVLFLGFSGEELGLLGSKKYVEAPLVPLADTVAMLNLDMVGRLDERLYVGGTGTSPLWPDALERQNQAGPRLNLKFWPGGKAPSDHESFYGKNVPVLFFFTGLHGDYHRPSDDWNTLNYDGHAKVARLAAAVALEVATGPTRPTFTKCDAGGFEVGPYLGLSVDPKPDGLLISHVDDKSPAKKAGVKEGDRLLEWAGTPLKDANGFNEFLSKSKPGDKVELVLERKGKRTKVTVTLGST